MTKNKMRNKKKKSVSYLDDDDDDDDIPLKMIKRNDQSDEDPNSYESLCRPSSQPCELCDRVSKNRYASLIHNVQHIIIPLLNQEVHQCEVCLHHFTSVAELTRHMSKKHSLSQLVSHSNLVKNNFNNPKDTTYESDLISIVKKEKPEPPSRKPDVREPALPNGTFSIKNRLVFEEDIISLNCDQLLSDLTTDCRVNVELFPPIWEEDYPKSVHYDELVKPGDFRCKKCGRTFPSRYETIIHEANHIFIKNSRIILCKICNEYILGDSNDLLNHKLSSHWKPDCQQTQTNTKDITRKEIGAKIEENGVDEPYTTKTTTLKLCDMCFSFCKNKTIHHYYCIKELSEVGTRYICDKCGYKFFDIKLVKRETKYKYSSYARKKNKAKTMSNETRLKIISNRFKMMKKNYSVVLFTLTCSCQ